MLLSVMLKDQAGGPVMIADLVRDFFVARAYVRTLLQEASAIGLVVRSGGHGRYRVQPLLIDAMRQFLRYCFKFISLPWSVRWPVMRRSHPRRAKSFRNC